MIPILNATLRSVRQFLSSLSPQRKLVDSFSKDWYIKLVNGSSTELSSWQAAFNSMTRAQRWSLVTYARMQKHTPTILFMHVPKTGGTTLGDALSKQADVAVISVDSEPNVFATQLYTFINNQNVKLLLARSHDFLDMLYSHAGVGLPNTYFISAYRPSIEVHVSNANMILRRFRSFQDNAGTLSREELAFCEDWKDRLGYIPDDTLAGAQQLLSSRVYIEYMGSIYAKHYNLLLWKRLIQEETLNVIHYQNFDAIYTEILSFENVPPRKNVADIKYISSESVPVKIRKKLLANDERICNFLEESITPVTEALQPLRSMLSETL